MLGIVQVSASRLEFRITPVSLPPSLSHFKTHNETAAKHLIDMDKLYKTNLQKLNDNIALKEENISKMNKELDKYKIPKPLPVASHVVEKVTPQNSEVIEIPSHLKQVKSEHLPKLAGYRLYYETVGN